MKKLLLIGLLLFVNIVHGQINTPVIICKVKSDTVIVKPEFIEILFFQNYKNVTPYKVVHRFDFSSCGGLYNYKVHLFRYNGWEDEEGDYEIADISCNKKNIFHWVNQEGMLLNQQFFQIDSTTSLIYFTSVPYNSNPGYLTLVILKGDKAYLVYNKISHIKSVGYINGVFTIKIIDQFAEYSEVDSNVQINNPIESDITYENGVLYIKQITSL